MNVDFLVPLLQAEVTPLLRTDFSDDQAWARVAERVTARVVTNDPDPEVPGNDGGYSPSIEPVSDPGLTGADAQAIADAWRAHRSEAAGYALLADARSMREAAVGEEPTVVYLDLYAEDDDAELGWIYGNSFRCIASEVAEIEANLSISNLDFSDFANQADGGVYRGS